MTTLLLFLFSFFFFTGVLAMACIHCNKSLDEPGIFKIIPGYAPIVFINEKVGEWFGIKWANVLMASFVLPCYLALAGSIINVGWLVLITCVSFVNGVLVNDMTLATAYNFWGMYMFIHVVNLVGMASYLLATSVVSMMRYLVCERRSLFSKAWYVISSPFRRLVDACSDPKERAKKKMRRNIAAILNQLDDSPRWDHIKEALWQMEGMEHSEDWFTDVFGNVRGDIERIQDFASKADKIIAQARAQGVTAIVDKVTELANEVYPKLISDHRRLTDAKQTMSRSIQSPDDLDTHFDAERFAELQGDYDQVIEHLGRIEESMLVCDRFLVELEADLASIAIADIVPFDVAGRLAAITAQTREIKENARTTAAEVAETTATAARTQMHLVATGQHLG